MERPKQRRHRCKDPTKLDINTLTGEERVPVIHRGTGRRVKTHIILFNVLFNDASRHVQYVSASNRFPAHKV